MDELYDLEADPYEMVNLAGAPEYQSVREELLPLTLQTGSTELEGGAAGAGNVRESLR